MAMRVPLLDSISKNDCPCQRIDTLADVSWAGAPVARTSAIAIPNKMRSMAGVLLVCVGDSSIIANEDALRQGRVTGTVAYRFSGDVSAVQRPFQLSWSQKCRQRQRSPRGRRYVCPLR